MSHIFYSEVDVNLQTELQLRGNAAKTRATTDIDFMLGTLANVQLTAYLSGSSSPNEIVPGPYGILGGDTVRGGRYLPTGEDGFLQESNYTLTNIEFDTSGQAYTKSTPLVDRTYRIGPIITSVDVTIGDHSMGLLNKATIRLSIPNPDRDLDGIEDTWLRPGRYMKLEIVHPDSVILSRQQGGGIGLLSKNTIPNKTKLKELYPDWNLDELENKIRKMNEYSFEGLITSFDLQYQSNGQVDVTISVTGTSNVYTDVSMWIKSSEKKDKDKQQTKVDATGNVTLPAWMQGSTVTPNQQTPVNNINAAVETDVDANYGFYDKLFNSVNNLITRNSITSGTKTGVLNFNSDRTNTTDQYIVFGEPYDASEIDNVDVPQAAGVLQFTDLQGNKIGQQIGTSNINQVNESKQQSKLYNDTYVAKSLFSRYITLGALIQFVNDYLTKKLESSVKNPKILCDTEFSRSNYYEQLVSCIPEQILLLPKETNNRNGMNCYGGNSGKRDANILWFYKDINQATPNSQSPDITTWPGVHTTSEAIDTNYIYASRILINLQTIQRILNGVDGKGGLTEGGKKSFQLKAFLAAISSKINYATAGAITMNLVSHPDDETKLLFVDSKYLKTPLVGELVNVNKNVTPFKVPMTAGGEHGSIVQEFNMTAQLPENAKNLAYVLNEGDVASEEDIAPYLNFMYNAKNPDAVNAAIAKYKDKYIVYSSKLEETKEAFASAPYWPERSQDLYTSLSSYVKYPTDNIRKSQQIIAPIFPFSVDFKIDGINGFRYGDVLEFTMLPSKYRVNTVFSIISITQTVSTNGNWTTSIKCIMRPSIK